MSRAPRAHEIADIEFTICKNATTPVQQEQVGEGKLSLDTLTRTLIHDRYEYPSCDNIVTSSQSVTAFHR
jgi:hypothetical protein